MFYRNRKENCNRAGWQLRSFSSGSFRRAFNLGWALGGVWLLLLIYLPQGLIAYSEKQKQEELNRELINASGKGFGEHVKLLLEAGAEVNAKLGSNKTALALAVEGQHIDIVELLLVAGADANIQFNSKTFQKGTVLMRVAKNGNTEIAELLLERGAKANLQDRKGSTALMIAAANGHLEIADLLLENEANLDLKDNYGYTALHLSAANGHLEIVELLLDEGADATAKNRSGNTAIDIPWEKRLDKRRSVRERGIYNEITDILKEAWEEQIEIKKEAAEVAARKDREKREADKKEKEKKGK